LTPESFNLNIESTKLNLNSELDKEEEIGNKLNNKGLLYNNEEFSNVNKSNFSIKNFLN
jgi:hypothetical protein